MALDYGCHVTHCAVTALHVIPIEEFVVAVVTREVLVNELKEEASYIRGYVLVEWRVEPDYLTGSCRSPFFWSGIFKFTVEVAVAQGSLIQWLCFVKFSRITRQ